MSFSEPRKLDASDDVSGFSCGAELIDDWFRRRAAGARGKGTAVVYVSRVVAPEDAAGAVAGFYTLSAYSINRASVSGGWLARNAPSDIPAILLGMLAVDSRFAGRGLGEALLRDAVLRSLAIAGELGARALVVDPLNDDVVSFYERFGFKAIAGTGKLALRLG